MIKFDERFWITIVVVVGVLAFDLTVHLIPGHLDSNLLSGILAILNAQGFVLAVNWWFQSSKSSADKDQTIRDVVNKVP